MTGSSGRKIACGLAVLGMAGSLASAMVPEDSLMVTVCRPGGIVERVPFELPGDDGPGDEPVQACHGSAVLSRRGEKLPLPDMV
jgi:hypothetical protein